MFTRQSQTVNHINVRIQWDLARFYFLKFRIDLAQDHPIEKSGPAIAPTSVFQADRQL